MPFGEKCVYFGFVHAYQSMSALFRVFKMAKQVDVVNLTKKSAKKMRTSRINNICSGQMAEQWISKRLKGKVMGTCVTPACLYGNGNLGNDRTTTTKAASVRK